MKAAYIMLAVCLLALGLATWGVYGMHTQAHDMISLCSQGASAAQSGDIAAAQEAYAGARELWRTASVYWKMIVSHEEMGRISTRLAGIGSDIDNMRPEEAHKELMMLIEELTSIDEEFFPHMGNIF